MSGYFEKNDMRPIYYDTETTGVRPGKDRIIELAAFDPTLNKTFSALINPECPIPAESTAICHITDDMVQNAPLFKDIADDFIAFCQGDVVLIAHNNDGFDKHFMLDEFQRMGKTMPDWLFIDTLKWSRKYRPDLPRHTLQFLREVYQIPANEAHRALNDVMILHQVFSKMIDDLPISLVLQLLSQSSEITRMPFGKHQGKSFEDIPKSYFSWLSSSGALEKKENAPLRDKLLKLGLHEETK